MMRIRTFALVAALVAMLCIPQAAWGYFSKPAVGLSFGSSAVSLSVGQTSNVAVICDLWSEQQLPGCGMAECPQACSNKVTPDGVLGGCLNAEGWCTCAGLSYTTAHTQITVSSSNPSVCRASVSGSTVALTAYAPGSATITATASLSKHADARASLNVTVGSSSGAGSGAGAGGSAGGGSAAGVSVGGAAGSSAGAGAGGASGQASGSGSDGGTVTVTTNVLAAAAAQAQAQAQGEDVPQVVEMTRDDGSSVIVAQATDAATAKEELAKIAGTSGTCTFWSGGSMDAPLLSMTFRGEQLSPDADLEFDPSVEITRKGSGAVATLLEGADDDTIVMQFAHEGALPAPAEVYVRASSVFADGTQVGLFCFDEPGAAFQAEQDGIEVADGYAVFTLEHCSDWALSPSDLSGLAMPEGVDASRVDVHAGSALPFLIGGASVVVIAAVAVAAVVTRRKKAAGVDAADEDAASEGAAEA